MSMSKAMWGFSLRVSLALTLFLAFPCRFGAQDNITYNYDRQGRLTKLRVQKTASVTYRYDHTGRLTSVTEHKPVPGATR